MIRKIKFPNIILSMDEIVKTANEINLIEEEIKGFYQWW